METSQDGVSRHVYAPKTKPAVGLAGRIHDHAQATITGAGLSWRRVEEDPFTVIFLRILEQQHIEQLLGLALLPIGQVALVLIYG